MATASEPGIASSSTWTPLSAPICSALLHRVGGLLGADGERGHLDVVTRLLLDLQRLLDGVLVQLGEQPVDTDAVDRVVGPKWRSAVASGTYFTQTTMFIACGRDGPSCALDVWW